MKDYNNAIIRKSDGRVLVDLSSSDRIIPIDDVELDDNPGLIPSGDVNSSWNKDSKVVYVIEEERIKRIWKL